MSSRKTSLGEGTYCTCNTVLPIPQWWHLQTWWQGVYMLFPLPSNDHMQDIVTAKAHQQRERLSWNEEVEKVSIIDFMVWLHCIKGGLRGLKKVEAGNDGRALMCSDINLMVKSHILKENLFRQTTFLLSRFTQTGIYYYFGKRKKQKPVIKSAVFRWNSLKLPTAFLRVTILKKLIQTNYFVFYF